MISVPVTPTNRSVALTALSTINQNRWAAALALPLVVGPVWCLAWQGQFGWLGTLSGFVLLAVLMTSAITDFQQQKIYNWATYSAFLWALAINVVATSLSWGENSPDQAYHRATIGPELLGGVGLGQCLAGAALCFIATLAGYHLSSGGAGDVKLATAIGSLLGVHDGIFAVGYSYIIAAIAIVAWSIYHSGPLALVKAAGRTMGAVLGPLWPFPPRDSDAKLLLKPIPLGPYFAIGTLLVVLELVPS
jgi:Flp pilus assembly protein protease CpaA